MVETLPLQFQPCVIGRMVGIMVGFDEVGARVKGAEVGEGVGFDGQLVMPSLKAQRALASDCCGLMVGAMDCLKGFPVGRLDGWEEGCLDGCRDGFEDGWLDG